MMYLSVEIKVFKDGNNVGTISSEGYVSGFGKERIFQCLNSVWFSHRAMFIRDPFDEFSLSKDEEIGIINMIPSITDFNVQSCNSRIEMSKNISFNSSIQCDISILGILENGDY